MEALRAHNRPVDGRQVLKPVIESVYLGIKYNPY